VDFIFGKVLGFVCGRRTIKTGKVLWQQIKHLPTQNALLQQIKNDVGSFFETAHP